MRSPGLDAVSVYAHAIENVGGDPDLDGRKVVRLERVCLLGCTGCMEYMVEDP